MFTLSTRLVTASSSSTALPTAMTPALFTTTSMGPSWSSTADSSISPIATVAPNPCKTVAAANPMPRAHL